MKYKDILKESSSQNNLNGKYREDHIHRLKLLQTKYLEFWNDFDWQLKEKYKMKYIDLIDYDNGTIIIITHI